MQQALAILHTPELNGMYIKRARAGRGGGTQYVVRFPNNYGASVVQGEFTYGHEDGLWELAVIQFNGPTIDEHNLTYDTPITDDVIGYLTPDDVANYLRQISELPTRALPPDNDNDNDNE